MFQAGVAYEPHLVYHCNYSVFELSMKEPWKTHEPWDWEDI